MKFEDVLAGVRRPELVELLAVEARQLRRKADAVRRESHSSDPPPHVDANWWDEQARSSSRALDDAAARLESAAHLPPQVDPLDPLDPIDALE